MSGRPVTHKPVRHKQLCVPCNWDPKLLDLCGQYPSITAFYGKPRIDIVGGGRAPYALSEASKEKIETFIGACRKKGLSFYFLLNPFCLGNKEFDPDFNRHLLAYVEWLIDIGVDKVIVAIPYLLRLIKANFPSLKVTVSKFADIRTVQQARYWEEAGADEIALSGNITRNFRILRKITKAISIPIQLLVHDACLWNCHLQNYHHLMESHASQEGHTIPYFRYCTMHCRQIFLRNPAEIIRSTFVRPEDLHYYMELGITTFKLVDRNRPTDWIANAVKAYHEERYDGNLADLLSLFSTYGEDVPPSEPIHVHLGDFEQVERLQHSPHAQVRGIYIDNRKLDGFLEGFIQRRCEELICDVECTYCAEIAAKAITVDIEECKMVAYNLKQLVETLEKGAEGLQRRKPSAKK